MARLNRIWQCNTSSFANKFKLYKSLVTSIFLYGCETWTLLAQLLTLKKGSRLLKPSASGNFSTSLTWEHKTNDWVQSKTNFLLGPQEPLLATVKRQKVRNLHGLGMSHTMTASPKPSFKAPWTVGDAVDGRINAGWTTSKSGQSCLCQTCSPGSPAEKTGRGFVLTCPSCPPGDPVGQGT